MPEASKPILPVGAMRASPKGVTTLYLTPPVDLEPEHVAAILAFETKDVREARAEAEKAAGAVA